MLPCVAERNHTQRTSRRKTPEVRYKNNSKRWSSLSKSKIPSKFMYILVKCKANCDSTSYYCNRDTVVTNALICNKVPWIFTTSLTADPRDRLWSESECWTLKKWTMYLTICRVLVFGCSKVVLGDKQLYRSRKRLSCLGDRYRLMRINTTTITNAPWRSSVHGNLLELEKNWFQNILYM